MKKIFLLLFLPVLLFSIELKPIKLKLQWKHQFEFAGFYMAKELGYYEAMGIDVEFLEYDGTGNIVKGLEQGEYELAVAGSSVVDDWQNNSEILLLANYFKRSPLSLVTRAEIKSPLDLVGKRIMISKTDRNSAYYKQIFDTFNINEENTEFLIPDFNFNSFDELNIDAYSVFLTNEPHRLFKNNVQYNVISPNTYGVVFNDVNLITSINFSKNRNLFLKKFVEASNKGWKYALENRDEAVEIILEKYNTQNKTKEELLYEAKESIQFIMPKSYEIGSVDLEQFEKISSLFYENGWSKIKKDINDFYFFNEKSNSLSFEESNYLANKNMTLNICVDPDWMPFEKVENGKHVGISSEIIQIVADDLGLKLNLVDTNSWSETLEYAKQRKCDILPMAMKTNSRLKYLNFTESYIQSPYVIATSDKQVYVNKIEDVLDKRIALVKGYAHTELLKLKHPNNNFIEVNNVEEGLKLLNEGKIFGFFDALITTAYEVQRKNYINIKISGTFNDNWDMAIASRNDEPILNEILEKSLSKISEDKKREIFNKWFKVRVDEKIDYRILIFIVVLFSSIILVTLYWISKIHKEKEKTKKSLEEISKLKNILEVKNKELIELSITDQLTKLFNRRKIVETIDTELKRFKRTNSTFAIFILDIDHFKSVNDKYGHNVGDSVLVEFSSLLNETLRVTDIIGRWGGEEFIVVATDIDINNAEKLANNLREKIANHKFKDVDKITTSIGITVAKSQDNRDDLIERADNALYDAKNGGRNRVCKN